MDNRTPVFKKLKEWRRLFKKEDGSGSKVTKKIQQDVCPPRILSATSVAVVSSASPVIPQDGIPSTSGTALPGSAPSTIDSPPGISQTITPSTTVFPLLMPPVITISPPEIAVAGDQDQLSDIGPSVNPQEPQQEEEAGGLGRLWPQAYIQLERDESSKSLLGNYKVLLNGDLQEGDKGYKDPAKQELMAALIKEKLQVMTRKQWTLTWGKTSFIVREQAEKIVKVVQQFSGIGSSVASLDPTHAGIAWAGVCALLPLILNEFSEQHKAMDGLEDVSKILARYSAVEKLIVARKAQEADHDFEQSIVTLYKAILTFQATAAYHFGRKTFPRMVANITLSNGWSGMLKEVHDADQNCQAFITIKSTQMLLKRIQKIAQGFDRDLYEKWQQDKNHSDEILRQWTDNRIKASEAHQEENEKIVNWISDAKVGQDHGAIREKLGATHWNSGQWFFKPPEDETNHFEIWKLSQRGQIWLRGSVGTGKSSLTSIVINHLIENDLQDRLAFYYCSRNSSANTPLAILRSLVAQLVWSSDGLEISDEVKKIRKKQTSRRNMESLFSILDCVDLLVTLINLHGPTAIVLDGLDECEGSMQLLWKLFEVWTKSKHLKLFFSSREGVEVSKVFSEAVIVRTEPQKSSSDVRTYIIKELSRKERRNKAVVGDELARRMVTVLTQLSDGMFRWVELQLDLFISPERPIKHRKDFEARLQKLELEQASGREVVDRLGETYEEIFQRNVQGGEFSQKLAIRALQWVLCALRPFELPELRAAIAVEDNDVTETLLLDLCSNFIHVDGKAFVRLAHISVKEYLELKKIDGRLRFSLTEAHAEAVTTCFRYWGSAFKEIRPPLKMKNREFLRAGLASEIQKISPNSPVLVRDPEVGRKYTSSTCSYVSADQNGDKAVAEVATISWRSYASLYWASHYENATRQTFHESSQTILKKNLVSFLGGHDENAALLNWLGEMAQLRYAFRNRGAGLGDRTQSPGPHPHRSPSRSPSSFPMSSLDKAINELLTDERTMLKEDYNTWEGKGVEVNLKPGSANVVERSRRPYGQLPQGHSIHDFKAKDRGSSRTTVFEPLTRDRSIYMAPSLEEFRNSSPPVAPPRPTYSGPPRRIHQSTLDCSHQIRSDAIYIGDIGDHKRMATYYRSSDSSLSDLSTTITPVVYIPGHVKDIRPSGPEPLRRLWLSDLSYSKDRTVFWDQWKDVSSFPFEGLRRRKRRIAFLTACVFGFEHVIRSVCNIERCTDYRNHNGLSGLHLAARQGYVGIVRLLIEHGMKEDYMVKAGTTALHEACSEGNLEVAEYLLDAISASDLSRYVNIRDSHRRSPLHVAVENDNSEIVVMLLKQPGVDINAQDRDSSTPLHAAWKYSEKSLHLLLKDSRIDTKIEDVFGKKYNIR